MPDVDFANMPYAELKAYFCARLPISAASAAQCDELEAVLEVLELTVPSESEKAGERIAMRDLEKYRLAVLKRRGVLCHNARPFETVVPSHDLQ